MKHFAKLAVLGAALVAAAPFASADSFLTGSIGLTDSPAGYTESSGVFTLTSITVGSSQPGQTVQPTDGGGTPILYYFYENPLLDLFSTDQASGSAVWSGTETGYSPTTGSDTLTFFATGFSTPLVDPTSGQISFTISGYFTDSDGLLLETAGIDSVTFNPNSQTPGDGLLTENLVALAPAPEPSSLVLLGSGLVTTGGALLRRRKVNA